MIYNPSPVQKEFHSLQVDEALFGGSAGPGKSLTLLMEPLEQIVIEHNRCARGEMKWGHSTGRCLHFRREIPRLEESISRSKMFYPAIDEGARWEENKHIWTFSSGYKIQFAHMKDADAFMNYRSIQCCMEVDSPLRMADGSWKAIGAVRVGDFVDTLEGPRRVTATYSPYQTFCVEASSWVDGVKIGSQVQPSTHPVLTSALEQTEPSCRSCHTSSQSHQEFAIWQDYESLLCGRQESPVIRVSSIDAQSGFVTFDGLRLEVSQLPELSVPVVLHAPTLRSEAQLAWTSIGFRAPSYSCKEQVVTALECERRPQEEYQGSRSSLEGHQRLSENEQACYACAMPSEQNCSQIDEDSRCRCSSCLHRHDEQFQHRAGTSEGAAPSQGDAALPSRRYLRKDGEESIPVYIPPSCASYSHFYTGHSRKIRSDLVLGTCVMTPVGVRTVCDITVEGSNHYISKPAIVNCQTMLLFDELIEFEKDQYEQMVTRVRSTDPVLQKLLKVRSASNPAPGWVREYFVDPAPQGRVVLKKRLKLDDGTYAERTRIFIPARLSDNPDPEYRRQYEINLQDKPAHIRSSLLHGDWYVVAGAFFANEWVAEKHVIKPFRIPRDWRRFRSGDWGYKSPCVILWWAVTPDNELICYRERTFKEKTAKQVAEAIKQIEMDAGEWDVQRGSSRCPGPMDTQLWEERGHHGPTMASDMAEIGVNWTKANKKSRATNAQNVMSRLKSLGLNGRPALMFFETCKQCISTIPSLQTDKGTPEEPEKGGSDHWYDAVSYACSHYALPQEDGKSFLDDDDDFDELQQARERKLGRYGYGGF